MHGLINCAEECFLGTPMLTVLAAFFMHKEHGIYSPLLGLAKCKQHENGKAACERVTCILYIWCLAINMVRKSVRQIAQGADAKDL